MKYVALLRGVNVGGKNMLPMASLAAIVRDAGGTDVATYIQSGNVVFSASARILRTFEATVVAAIMASHGIRTPVVLRSAAEVAATIAGNPFRSGAAPVTTLHVMFLAAQPSAASVAALDANRSPADAFAVRGRDIYLHLPGGVAGTKLTNAYFDAKLATTSTMRNWNTVLRIAELLGVPPPTA